MIALLAIIWTTVLLVYTVITIIKPQYVNHAITWGLINVVNIYAVAIFILSEIEEMLNAL